MEPSSHCINSLDSFNCNSEISTVAAWPISILFCLMDPYQAGKEMLLRLRNVQSAAITLPHIPSIVSEWAAIIPLVIHLASPRDEDSTVGEISLLGRLSIGIFPKLGFFKSLQKLLTLGSDFIDQASFKGDSSRIVWDIRWGSVFPCANTAVTASIMSYILRMPQSPAITMPNTPPSGVDKQSSSSDKPGDSSPVQKQKSLFETKKDSVRMQNLHILQVERKQGQELSSKKSNCRIPDLAIRILIIIALVLTSAVLVACDAYGTAAVIIVSAVSRTLCLKQLVTRPSGYMKNNETHDACMLVANHENSAEWYLFIGDRAVVDTLLNKPMIHVTQTYPLVAAWFGAAHFFQIGAMTFTAGQKGWDAIALVTFVFLDTIVRYRFRVEFLVKDFLAKEGIQIKTKSFKFTGRTILMASIQVFSNSKVISWMDSILVPHPRRDAILAKLKLIDGDPGRGLSPSEGEWVEYSSALIKASAQILTEEFLAENV